MANSPSTVIFGEYGINCDQKVVGSICDDTLLITPSGKAPAPPTIPRERSPAPLPGGHPLWTTPSILITTYGAHSRAMTVPLLAERIRVNVAGSRGEGRFVGLVGTVAGL